MGVNTKVSIGPLSVHSCSGTLLCGVFWWPEIIKTIPKQILFCYLSVGMWVRTSVLENQCCAFNHKVRKLSSSLLLERGENTQVMLLNWDIFCLHLVTIFLYCSLRIKNKRVLKVFAYMILYKMKSIAEMPTNVIHNSLLLIINTKHLWSKNLSAV